MQIKFENGNVVNIGYKGQKYYYMYLNGKDTVEVTAEAMAILLNDLRKITCVIDSWEAIR